MIIQVIQHDPLLPLGYIEDWANENDYEVKTAKIYEGEPLPVDETFDLLVVLGGRQTAYDPENYPFVVEEEEWLRKLVDEKQSILAICLGAQILSQALGGEVRRMAHMEIGWHTIYEVEEARQHPLLKGLPAEIRLFQHHQDFFSIPERAEKVYYNQNCNNQGFVVNDNILAVQFHPEITPVGIEEFLAKDQIYEPEEEVLVQTEKQIINDEKFEDGRKYLYSLMENYKAVIKQPVPEAHEV
ncbi:type 1 glutamine amidotransferase [Salinicoccus halitifaciens]|uniref:GMP synthase-like glutamine amidotransferase n=1 Tax=Salinicoccus halitifaciens TaxID=1073415 RepID=A0ABV2EAG2_9STAP|nr:type 1 glutamine amidotransferase [Salinicoccus halitifaciens]MCD2138548.1 type 1 glutamine amidotransferase [Salinicoccus halitifaciens]